MEILIIILITTVVFGLCFRFAPQVDRARKAKELRDHDQPVKQLLEITRKSEQERPQPGVENEGDDARQSSGS